MDPLSIKTGIVAILGVLISSIELAREVWGASDDLQRLSTDVSEVNELASRLVVLT